jgi:hypothetical protein
MCIIVHLLYLYRGKKLFKKSFIILFLVILVAGFTMSPVSAKEYNYYINGKVGDVFKVDRFYNECHG